MDRNPQFRLAALAFFLSCLFLWAGARISAAQTSVPAPTSVSGQVATYGDRDLVGFHYPPGADPTAGARLTGLAPGVITLAAQGFGHGFPFKAGDNDPDGAEEYPDTDQIFVGSNQTGQHDGYAGFDGRKQGPATFSLDYNQLVPTGAQVKTITLGIAADDFQFSTWGQPFSATVNGQPNRALTVELNKIDDTGPMTRFLTVGIDPAILTPDHVLTVAIDEGGDGGDGFAVDFLTVGVTTSAGAPAAPAQNGSPLSHSAASSSGAITSQAQVVVKDKQGVEVHLKPEEKIAVMFMEAISSMEDDCNRHLNRRCSLAELVAGPKSPGWNIGRLKYDPARDTNYKYIVTINGDRWIASASPQRAGLGGFFYYWNHSFIADAYYNPNGAATVTDKQLGDISISGELFQAH